MTRPIPVSGQRQRRSKSCTACRAIKTKVSAPSLARPLAYPGTAPDRIDSRLPLLLHEQQCKGLDEEFLHIVDDPDALAVAYPAGPSTYPRCERCAKNGLDCSFAPSRRKGRPRRLAAGQGGAIRGAVAASAAAANRAASESGASSFEDDHVLHPPPRPSTLDAANMATAAATVTASSSLRNPAEPTFSTSELTTLAPLSTAIPSVAARSAFAGAQWSVPAQEASAGQAYVTAGLTPSPSSSHSYADPAGFSSASSRPTSNTSDAESPAYDSDRSAYWQLNYDATKQSTWCPPGSVVPSAPPLSAGFTPTGLMSPQTPGLDLSSELPPPLFTRSPLPESTPGSSSGSYHRALGSSSSSSMSSVSPATASAALPAALYPSPPHHGGHDERYLGHLHALAARCLDEAYEWIPFLPAAHDELVSHLACSRPILTEAIECLLEPLSRRCPCVDLHEGPGTSAGRDGLTEPSLGDLQAATILSVLAFAQRERNRAIELLQFACRKLAARGWRGEATRLDDPVFTRSGLEDPQQLLALGWHCWGLEIQLGIITGLRASILSPLVPPPAVLDASTVRQYSFHAAFLATDYAYLWSLDTDDERCAYLRRVLSLVHSVHSVSLSALAAAQYPPYPVQLNAPRDRARRQDLILSAMLGLAGAILILSSSSPLSPYVAPALPCSLDTTARPAPNSRHLHAIAQSAKGIVQLVQEYGTTYRVESDDGSASDGGGGEGDNSPMDDDEARALATRNTTWPETIHHPFFGCCLVVAARGLLILGEDLQHEVDVAPDPAAAAAGPTLLPAPSHWLAAIRGADKVPDPRGELRQIAAELDLAEGFLRVQATRWHASEMLANEVSLLRRTANFA